MWKTFQVGEKLSGTCCWHWEWGIREEEGKDMNSSQNREGSAINHMNCLAPTWKEREVSWICLGFHMVCYLGLSNGSRNKVSVGESN